LWPGRHGGTIRRTGTLLLRRARMDRDRDPGGDYGYDMAHEAVTGSPPAEEPAAPQHQEPSPAPHAPEPGTDLAYDESHDF
jgi:hypothetical protein